MNEAIVERWNSIVAKDDIVYHLGDVFLGGDINKAINTIKKLNGKIYYAYGNHCTDRRIAALKTLPNTIDVQMGYRIKRGKKCFILTHYPTLTGNTTQDLTYCLHGHTHQKTNFTEGFPLMYHVGVDSHNCFPVSFDKILQDIKRRKDNDNSSK